MKTITPEHTGNYGAELVELAARVCRVDLLPWQQQLFADLLSHDADGNLVHRTATVSTARQNGKTLCLLILAFWWATSEAARRGRPQNIVFVSNNVSKAIEILFDTLAPWTEAIGGVTLRRGNNAPSITFADGSRIVCVAATPNQHGRTADLVLVDEAFDIGTDVYFGALVPFTRTRRHSLICAWSTAGDQGSELLIMLRQQGMKRIETSTPTKDFFAEWSPPPGVDPSNWRDFAAYANPSLGHLIDLEGLESDAEANWTHFVRTGLNLWVTAAESWLPIGSWGRQTTEAAMPAGGILAVEKAADEPRWVGLRAVKTDDGVQVCVEFVTTSESIFRREIDRVMADRTVALLIPPGVDLRLAPDIRRRSKTVGIKEIRLWTSQIHAMILEGEVWHDGDAVLAEHVNRAVARNIEGAWYIVSSRSPGPIELCRCLVWAAAEVARHRTQGRAAFASS